MKTATCKRVWEAIMTVSKEVEPSLAKELQDAFCEFDCAWKEHADEFHGDNPPQEIQTSKTAE